MSLKDILGRAAPEERKKLFALWAQCATAEEMKQTSLSSGVSVSDEEAVFLLELKRRGMKRRTQELQDDELDNVAAGGCGKKEEPPAYRKGQRSGEEVYRANQEWADFLLDNEYYSDILYYY
ncbi:MAG: hypothetical protein ACLR94_17140 [Acutalibacteraceae bacterium]